MGLQFLEESVETWRDEGIKVSGLLWELWVQHSREFAFFELMQRLKFMGEVLGYVPEVADVHRWIIFQKVAFAFVIAALAKHIL